MCVYYIINHENNTNQSNNATEQSVFLPLANSKQFLYNASGYIQNGMCSRPAPFPFTAQRSRIFR